MYWRIILKRWQVFARLFCQSTVGAFLLSRHNFQAVRFTVFHIGENNKLQQMYIKSTRFHTAGKRKRCFLGERCKKMFTIDGFSSNVCHYLQNMWTVLAQTVCQSCTDSSIQFFRSSLFCHRSFTCV